MIGTFFWDKRKVLTSRETIICSPWDGTTEKKRFSEARISFILMM